MNVELDIYSQKVPCTKASRMKEEDRVRSLQMQSDLACEFHAPMKASRASIAAHED
jgi:hypothetical protein